MVSYAAQVHWRSWLARLHDTQEVTGSSPVWTILKDGTSSRTLGETHTKRGHATLNMGVPWITQSDHN